MISIIIPCYTSGQNLFKTLSSIYKNNFKDLEVIVVDDGSTDDVREMIKNFPLTYIQLDTNIGAAFARNKGAGLAKGDILVFLDADVEIKEDLLGYVEEQFKGFDYDALSGVFSKEPKINNIFLLFQSTLSNYNFRNTDFTFSGHLGAIRKTVFDELSGFNESSSIATVEDFEFSQRLIASGYKCKTDIHMDAYHNKDFTFFSLLKRMFRFGLLKTPIILEYNHSAAIQRQKRRYLVNAEYIYSYLLISLFPAVIILTLFPKFNPLFLLIWFMVYIGVKRKYLLSLEKKRAVMFLLLIMSDIVVFIGCLTGGFRYYVAQRSKKNYHQA